MEKGVFCLSLDTELLWGRKNINWQDFVWQAKKVRSVIKRLLELFEKYDISATWAVVGKLFEKGNSLWHGPDIVKEIKKHKNQEIACHSYSHPDFDKLTKEEATEEIKKCPKAVSFVFPRNRVAHLDILKTYRYQIYRGKDLREWELLYPGSPPVYQPRRIKGLINIPGSMYFVSSRGIRKHLPGWLRILKSKMGIKRAISEKKIFHLWFHPIDLADEPDKLIGSLEKIIIFANQKRQEAALEIMTMEKIASNLGI